MGKITPKHILVIRLSAMGDAAMTVPVLQVFAQTYPEIKITVLSKPFLKPLFNKIPNVNFFAAEVKSKHKGILGLLKLAIALRKLDINAVADLHNVLRSKLLRTFLGFYGIPASKINKGRTEKKALTRESEKQFVQLKTTHQRYADVFKALGFPLDLSTFDPPKKQDLSPRLNALFNDSPKKVIGIAPFAAFHGKMYPIDLMEKVIEILEKQNQYQIFLFGGGKQEIEVLERLGKTHKTITNIAGKLDFEDELRLISNLDVMLAMDSGNAHLSALYGVKTITLWGLTHPYAGFAPFNQDSDYAILANREKYPLIPTSVYGNTCPEGYEDAMKSISPETVAAKIIQVLG